MAAQEDPIKRLRDALGLDQKAFGALVGDVNQSSVSEWEGGAALSLKNAQVLWERYGSRLRGMGCRFQDLLVRRSPKRPRRRAHAADEGASGAAA